MSKFVEKEMSCMMCGHVNTVTILTAATTEGSADLDSRPPEKRRSAMPLWVHQCDNCAAVFSVFEQTPKVDKNFLKSQKYENCAEIAGLPSLAKSFVKIALIYEQAGEMKKAGNYFLNAAWCCDDEKLDVNARLCRDEALRCWNEVDVSEINKRELPELQIKILDTLRRAEHFKDARNFGKCIRTNDENMIKVIAFENSKSIEKDSGCYTLADAIRK